MKIFMEILYASGRGVLFLYAAGRAGMWLGGGQKAEATYFPVARYAYCGAARNGWLARKKSGCYLAGGEATAKMRFGAARKWLAGCEAARKELAGCEAARKHLAAIFADFFCANLARKHLAKIWLKKKAYKWGGYSYNLHKLS